MKKKNQCTACWGKGEVEPASNGVCANCEGKGMIYVDYHTRMMDETCPECNGSGKRTGPVTCKWCNGIGVIV